MRVWKCKQVIDFDQSTTTVKEERNKTLQQQTTDKYNRFQVVTHMQMLGPQRTSPSHSSQICIHLCKFSEMLAKK